MTSLPQTLEEEPSVSSQQKARAIGVEPIATATETVTPEVLPAIPQPQASTTINPFPASIEVTQTDNPASRPSSEAPVTAPALVGTTDTRPVWMRRGLEPPAGTRPMGTYTMAVFTPEQQARLQIDEQGNPLTVTGAPAPVTAAVASDLPSNSITAPVLVTNQYPSASAQQATPEASSGQSTAPYSPDAVERNLSPTTPSDTQFPSWDTYLLPADQTPGGQPA